MILSKIQRKAFKKGSCKDHQKDHHLKVIYCIINYSFLANTYINYFI